MRTPCFSRLKTWFLHLKLQDTRIELSLSCRSSISLLKINHNESLEFYRKAVTTLLISEFKHYFHLTYIPFRVCSFENALFLETRNLIFASQTSRHENRVLSKQRSPGCHGSSSLLKINHNESLEFYWKAAISDFKHCFKLHSLSSLCEIPRHENWVLSVKLLLSGTVLK